MKHGKILLAAAILTFAFLLAMNAASKAEDCPAGAPSCKVVIITPQEEQTLIGQNAIFDAAEFANKMGLAAVIAAWKQKLAVSPAGTVKPATDPNANPTIKKDAPKK